MPLALEGQLGFTLIQFTTQLSVDPKLQFKGLEKGIVPTQILFCLKEKVRELFRLRRPLC